MKIICTKREWTFLNYNLLSKYDTAEQYEWPHAKCSVSSPGIDDLLLEIEIEFIEEPSQDDMEEHQLNN